METFPKNIQKVASDSFKIIAFSPDKTKVLYQTDKAINLPLAITPPMIASNQTPEERILEAETIYVYDKKEDKNYKISNQLQNSNAQNNQLGQLDQLEINHSIFWYPDSQHLVINEEKQISVVYYDGQNKQIVYSGPFEQSFLGITTDGKLLILTNLNSKINKLPDIYAVGI